MTIPKPLDIKIEEVDVMSPTMKLIYTYGWIVVMLLIFALYVLSRMYLR